MVFMMHTLHTSALPSSHGGGLRRALSQNWANIFYFTAVYLLPTLAFAAYSCRASNYGKFGGDDMTFVMCYVACVMYSGVGRAIAIIGVVVLGFGATFGKVSWGLALTVAVGVTTIFGAPRIIYFMIGETVPCYDADATAMTP